MEHKTLGQQRPCSKSWDQVVRHHVTRAGWALRGALITTSGASEVPRHADSEKHKEVRRWGSEQLP